MQKLSVKPDNIVERLGNPDFDGALMGGARLDVEESFRIIRYKRVC